MWKIIKIQPLQAQTRTDEGGNPLYKVSVNRPGCPISDAAPGDVLHVVHEGGRYSIAYNASTGDNAGGIFFGDKLLRRASYGQESVLVEPSRNGRHCRVSLLDVKGSGFQYLYIIYTDDVYCYSKREALLVQQALNSRKKWRYIGALLRILRIA